MPASTVALRVKPNRHFPFYARHPWVHAHALAAADTEFACGQIVDLTDHDGNWLGQGLANPDSKLRVRLYSFDPDRALDDSLWAERIDAAIDRRRLDSQHRAGDDEAERLVFSESDLLSGLIVDRYADCLSVQFTAAGIWRFRDTIVNHLMQATGCRAIKIQIDQRTARLEGMEPIDTWFNERWAADEGETEDPFARPVQYRQNGLNLSVDLRSGQKTGGYLDQALNHAQAARYLTGRRVLDVCCYHGGFGLVAAVSGAAEVLGIDSSEAALQQAAENVQRNSLSNVTFRQADCFDALKELAGESQQFDAVILDPPRFAGSRHQVASAMRAYARLNALAIDLLPPGGILVTCSCSGRVSVADFHDMLTDVGKRRRRDLILLQTRGAAPDHPVAASCPESEYLKCVIAQVH
ncbi:class I SAM-dependent rRNA methyltransferase [Crateriforma conspicua]|uniref:Ribosomal RNA large subunit methyltransferase I n=1 Tax=Crateriforma conspicua TaxID=2527996 RepID=A0A5C5Y7S4_9PLAN|nr:class I SAM-dependent rRNA methyltransferase [Crateriforma conspicua]QDV64947.1 Ribosomal RNA large subunit methyltransferase I [Crateriforma conspicua]TWT70345.1 Ribosomal RNA large subunit methyltransferase I [Crateriforma conspicua]